MMMLAVVMVTASMMYQLTNFCAVNSDVAMHWLCVPSSLLWSPFPALLFEHVTWRGEGWAEWGWALRPLLRQEQGGGERAVIE